MATPKILSASSGRGKYIAWKTSEVRTIYGWYDPYPKAGDYFECPLAGGVFVYQLLKVFKDSARGADYFEATVRAIGYKGLIEETYERKIKNDSWVSRIKTLLRLS